MLQQPRPNCDNRVQSKNNDGKAFELQATSTLAWRRGDSARNENRKAIAGGVVARQAREPTSGMSHVVWL
jgi:hypothetical protein